MSTDLIQTKSALWKKVKWIQNFYYIDVKSHTKLVYKIKGILNRSNKVIVIVFKNLVHYVRKKSSDWFLDSKLKISNVMQL